MIPSAPKDIAADPGLDDANEAFLPYPDNGICGRLSDRWTVLVLWRLSTADGGRLRFSALKRELDGVSQRMLTLTLRHLERDGMVDRHYFPEVPPRVEYGITALGRGVLDALGSVNTWVRRNMASIDENRRAYDETAR